MGLAFKILSEDIYATLVFVILATIFIAPILFRNSFKVNSSS